jgi:hypothetical protein
MLTHNSLIEIFNNGGPNMEPHGLSDSMEKDEEECKFRLSQR